MDNLHPDHLADLRKSGLSDETIAAAGLYSVRPHDVRKVTGVDKVESLLAIPYSPEFARYKVFPPAVKIAGKKLRYTQPKASGVYAYIPQETRTALDRPQTTIGIVEGEKKALKACQEGIPCIGLGGLWNWLDSGRLLPSLKATNWQKRSVTLYPDSDVWKKSRVDLREAIYRLGEALEAEGARITVCALPDGPGGTKQGIDDYLCAHSVDDLNALPHIPLTHPRFKTAKQRIAARTAIEPHTTPTPQAVVVTMSDVHAEAVEWLWWPYVAIGKLTMLDGDPGTGKSLLMTQVAASLSRGDPLPDQQGRPTLATGGPHTTLLLSSEDGLADTLRPRLDQAGADTSKIHVLTGWTGHDQQTLQMFTLQHMDILEEAVARVKPSLVVIDPIQAYLGKIDMHRANETRPLLAALTRLAERYRFALVCIRHPSKPGQSGGKAIHRGLGSVDFIGAARTGLFVEQHPTDPGKVLLGQSKSNIGRLGRTQVFTKHEGVFEWCGVSRLTAELMAGSGRGPDPHSFLEAVCWLEDELKPGIPRASRELEEKAEEEGIARITLKRAKKALEVRSYKKDDAWLCQLPDLPIIDPPTPDKHEPLESLESLESLEPLDTIQRNQEVTMHESEEGERTGQGAQVDQVAQVGQVAQVAQVVTGEFHPPRAGEGRTRPANTSLTRRELIARNARLWDRPRHPERCPVCGHRDWDVTRSGDVLCIPCSERAESA